MESPNQVWPCLVVGNLELTTTSTHQDRVRTVGLIQYIAYPLIFNQTMKWKWQSSWNCPCSNTTHATIKLTESWLIIMLCTIAPPPTLPTNCYSNKPPSDIIQYPCLIKNCPQKTSNFPRSKRILDDELIKGRYGGILGSWYTGPSVSHRIILSNIIMPIKLIFTE